MSFAPLSAAQLHFIQMPHRPFKGRRSLGDLILIHGLAANSAFWHPRVLRALRLLVTVTAYDLRGHGRSSITPTGYSVERMVEDLRELLDYLNISQAHLLAHSFGGMIALLFSIRYPQRVKSLVIADTRLSIAQPRQCLGEFEAWPLWKKSFQQLGIQLDEQDPEGGYQLLIAMAHFQMMEKKDSNLILPHLFATHTSHNRGAQHWLKLDKITTIRQEVAGPLPFSAHSLSYIKCPVLALYGERSHSLATAKILLDYCPNSQLATVAGVGHFFPLLKPKWFAAMVLRFLRRLIER